MPETTLYCGRFAPTPSGPLHFGSLVSALGSYLDAKAAGGRWLLRIEDVDSGRSRPEHTDAIVRSLAAHGLVHDGETLVQSAHTDFYRQQLERLAPLLYACSCSRRKWQQNAKDGALGKVYAGTCRHCRQNVLEADAAVRLQLPDAVWRFNDRHFGECAYDLPAEIGDPVLRRKDGDYAYAIAAAADDVAQGITDIVRGADLLAHTPIQQFLHETWGFAAPRVLHLPLVLLPNGDKLSKQNHAPALDDSRPAENLLQALVFLGQDSSGLSEAVTPPALLAEAVRRWDIARLPAGYGRPA